MRDAMGQVADALSAGPLDGVVTAILCVLFLIAGGYLAFGQDHGRGLPLLRVVGVVMLFLLGYTVLSALGFRLFF